jgi:ketosteroid isomerase-like protein
MFGCGNHFANTKPACLNGPVFRFVLAGSNKGFSEGITKLLQWQATRTEQAVFPTTSTIRFPKQHATMPPGSKKIHYLVMHFFGRRHSVNVLNRICMRNNICLFFFLFCFFAVSAQTASQTDIAAIREKRESSNLAIAAHDVDGIAKHWLADFVQVRGNSAHLTGKDKVVAAWRQIFRDNPKIVYVRNPSEILVSEDGLLAWEAGKWVAFNSSSKGGNYSAMWKKAGGQWKLQAELFVGLH